MYKISRCQQMGVLHDQEWKILGKSWNSINIFYSVENSENTRQTFNRKLLYRNCIFVDRKPVKNGKFITYEKDDDIYSVYLWII